MEWIEDFPDLLEMLDDWWGRAEMPIEEFNALAQEMKTMSFSALGASTSIMREKVKALIGDALSGELLMKDFVRAVDPLLENVSYWNMVFRVNTTNATMGGHLSEIFGPNGNLDEYPLWQFVGPADSRNDTDDECPELICRQMKNRYFSKTDPEALRRLPPVHYQCRHLVRDVPAREAARVTVTDARTMPEPQEGWGFDKRDLIPGVFR